MNFWSAIIGIVAIVMTFEYLKTIAKVKRGQSDSKETEALREEVAALRNEIAGLRGHVEEQDILVDEAVSIFRPRLNLLRDDERSTAQTVESPEHE